MVDTFVKLPPDEIKRQMGNRLLDQIQYFGNRADSLPEWKDAARIRDVDDLWRIWPSLPILTKQDLRTRFHPLSIVAKAPVKGIVSSTGGSTGEPTPYLHDRAMLRHCTLARLYCRRKIGWREGMPTVGIWGSERDIGRQRSWRFRASAWLRNDGLIDGYQLDDSTVDRVEGFLKRRRNVAMYGFTTMLDFVAREFQKRDIAVAAGTVRVAWNGGEMLHDHQVEQFEQVFGVPILNFYGGRELSAMAWQTQRGGPLNVLRPLHMIEIVDEHDRPVQPGQSGRLICTSTVCRGTPFLRFEIGDLGVAASGDDCQWGVAALAELHGRRAGLLHLPDGTVLNNLFWNHLFKEFQHEADQFQIVVHSNDRLTIRLRGPGMSADRYRELRCILARALKGMPYEIRWLDRIPLTTQGKLLQVVNEK